MTETLAASAASDPRGSEDTPKVSGRTWQGHQAGKRGQTSPQKKEKEQDRKKSKSEERDDGLADAAKRQLHMDEEVEMTRETKKEEEEEEVPIDTEEKFKDIYKTIDENGCDSRNTRQSTRWLLQQQIESQRATSAVKVLIKNWWKYRINTKDEANQVDVHRVAYVKKISKEAGFTEEEVKTWSFSNKVGKFISPFCEVKVQTWENRQRLLDFIKDNHGNKKTFTSKEAPALQLQTDTKNKADGFLKWEPHIAPWD